MSRPLPQAIDAEKGLLGSILLSPARVMNECLNAGVGTTLFYHPAHRQIFATLLQMSQAGNPIDLITLTQRLEDSGKLDDVGGAALITELFTFVPTASNAAYYLDLIREKEAGRRYVEIGEALASGVIEPQEAEETIRTIREGAQAVSLSSVLSPRRFDPKNPPAPARAIYEMNKHRICTPGNITVISAKAKVGKSAVVGAFIAASTALDGDTLSIDSSNPEGHALVHFDTEQSPADHHLLLATAMFRLKSMDAPDWLRSYRIADIPTARRFELLEHELREAQKAHGGIHSVILDGVADYVNDPNDQGEVFPAVERIHRLAVQYDTAFICVLHVNPGSESHKTRGHLGSQLERKAETNLALEKDENGVTTVYTTNTRHAFVPKQDGPRFKWDDVKGMHVSVESGRAENARESADKLNEIAQQVFSDGALKYTAARDAIKRVARVKDSRAEVYFTDMKKVGIIAKDALGFWGIKQ